MFKTDSEKVFPPIAMLNKSSFVTPSLLLSISKNKYNNTKFYNKEFLRVCPNFNRQSRLKLLQLFFSVHLPVITL